jgi:hypothetical protein
MGIISPHRQDSSRLIMVGWREWTLFPELTDIPIKAKVDTGARTSALHAFYIEPYTVDEKPFVKFLIHPYQKNLDVQVECHAPVVDQRMVSDSGGHKENRYVIERQFVIGGQSFRAELTLTDRDSMLFRLLLGRNVLKNRYAVDSGSSFLLGGSSKAPAKFMAA